LASGFPSSFVNLVHFFSRRLIRQTIKMSQLEFSLRSLTFHSNLHYFGCLHWCQLV
jgi:hypothetical protein